ncbi:hypothetical protein GWI33_002074 [Rhynchophorus ferrugineus]|uniref:Uncharacterized protein n=1 Tax=Rhynchophorus ferrugineus TaxID=354439 RepID=A0A834IZS9_RHYFE|nr:hypothetical protein GWI33_002074 [Rhynchophorus ferrugineus]
MDDGSYEPKRGRFSWTIVPLGAQRNRNSVTRERFADRYARSFSPCISAVVVTTKFVLTNIQSFNSRILCPTGLGLNQDGQTFLGRIDDDGAMNRTELHRLQLT